MKKTSIKNKLPQTVPKKSQMRRKPNAIAIKPKTSQKSTYEILNNSSIKNEKIEKNRIKKQLLNKYCKI